MNLPEEPLNCSTNENTEPDKPDTSAGDERRAFNLLLGEAAEQNRRDKTPLTETLYTLDQAMPLCVERLMAHPTLHIMNRDYVTDWHIDSTEQVMALLSSKESSNGT